MRRFENRSVGVGLSASKQLLQKTDTEGKNRGFVSTGFTIGANYGLTGGATDLLDVNGDGLPDHLFKDPTSNTMKVRLNLGYSFSQPIDWASPAWSVDSITELQDLITTLPGTDAVKTGAMRLDDTVSLNVGAGINVGMFGGGGGLTLTTARQNIDFIDVNGDGLVDQVLRDPSEPNGDGHEWIHVKLNLGDRFASEQRWPMPGWTTTVDPGEFLPLDAAIKISGQKALNFKRSKNFSGSGEVQICVILCVGASFYYQEGSGYSALQFQDVDGDGKTDHVLKKHDDQSMYVKINKVGKTNLLRSVVRPIGGSFDLDYERKGNVIQQSITPRVDMPNPQWALSKTTIKLSPGATPSKTGDFLLMTHSYDEAFFDRVELESYGFHTCKTTRGVFNPSTSAYENGDGSSTEKVYLNQNYYTKGMLAQSVERGPNPKRHDLGVEALFELAEIQYDEPPAAVLAQPRTGSFFPKELSSQTTWFEGETNALTKSAIETDKRYDGAGNLVEMVADGDTDLAGDEVRYTVQFKFDAAAYFFRPELVRVLVPDANPDNPEPDQILRERRATYDDKGRITSMTRFLRGGKDPASSGGQTPYSGAEQPNLDLLRTAIAAGQDFGNMTDDDRPSGIHAPIRVRLGSLRLTSSRRPTASL